MANPASVTADWSSANFSAEYVGVYFYSNIRTTEKAIWTDVFNRIDALIDKDFDLSSAKVTSNITLQNGYIGGNYAGYADVIDENPYNGHFDIILDNNLVKRFASKYGENYSDLYKWAAAHELGHALGLRHPNDDPYDPNLGTDKTIMAYGDPPLSSFYSPLDLAALITKNGIENDDNAVGAHHVYRFYNKNTHGHFFTMSEAEAKTVAINMTDSFNYEGTGFFAFDSGFANVTPVYRFYNSTSKGHFFTVNAGERDTVINNLHEFSYEGIGFYAASGINDGSKEVYRFYNGTSHGHFFTADVGERDYVIANLGNDFHYEWVGFYV